MSESRNLRRTIDDEDSDIRFRAYDPFAWYM